MKLDLEKASILGDRWAEIEDSYRTSPYKAPLNLIEERERVFEAHQRGDVYNPQFAYEKLPVLPMQQIWEFLRNLKPEASQLDGLYYEKVAAALLEIEMLRSRDPADITGYTCLLYGLPTQELLASAREILDERVEDQMQVETEKSERRLSTEESARWIQEAIVRLGLNDWKAVPFEPMNARIAVNRLDKLVKIREGEVFTANALKRLLVHEVGVHVIRYENGVQQPISLFARGFTGYLSTEEGLAVYSEAQNDLLKAETLRKYAARVIAVQHALSHSFFETFKLLALRIPKDVAFQMVARIKRGLTDTSQPGAYTKDFVYLKGYFDVKQHLLESPDDYPLLFLGKFGLQHLPLVKELLAANILSLSQFSIDSLLMILKRLDFKGEHCDL